MNRPLIASQPTTLTELLAQRASDTLVRENGFCFFAGADRDDHWLRYHQLQADARIIASHIACRQASFYPSSPVPRALILCAPGPDYVRAFFGGLMAGATIVTAYPPRRNRTDHRLAAVIEDSDADIAFCDQPTWQHKNRLCDLNPCLQNLEWICVPDALATPVSAVAPKCPHPDDVAVLQYTSGSTGTPRGVKLTHSNLYHNLQLIQRGFEITDADAWGVTWLPPYHDMGLIGGLLQVLFSGVSTYVMPPAEFIARPISWLRAISDRGATISGGPNFAYEHCLSKITSEQCQGLDLSSWSLAFNGAEPVSSSTLDRFAERFGPYGFQKSAFFPCYGLAEATLMVSGGPRQSAPKTASCPPSMNADGDTGGNLIANAEVISCGRPLPGQYVRVVAPESGQVLSDNELGEIWVSGPSVSAGYYGKSKETEETFSNTIRGEDGSYLRTGDLGFLRDGELYVSGRIKDLIVLRGRNLFPNEIEAAVREAAPEVPAHGCVAFRNEELTPPGLAVACEVPRGRQATPFERLLDDVRATIADRFDIPLSNLITLKAGTLPRTSSGKPQRLQCKAMFASGELRSIESWSREPVTDSDERKSGACVAKPERSTTKRDWNEVELRSWLGERLSEHLGVAPASIDLDRPFVQYGIDSVTAVAWVGELETVLERDLPATLLYDATNIRQLAAQLSSKPASRNSKEATPRGAAPSSRSNDLAEMKEHLADPVVITGVACRLPGAPDIESFWQLIRDGRVAIQACPEPRRRYVDPRLVITKAGWLEETACFDAAAFGIAPAEAVWIDPQHRLLLESTWHAIEHAGYDPRSLAGSQTGVFVGIASDDYRRQMIRDGVKFPPHAVTGNASSMAAHRLSYHFDLTGPSLSVDTACSSSLVAVHQARRAILGGDCEQAIVAGVNLIGDADLHQSLEEAGMLSPESRCRAFDAGANGYVRGEGVVAMTLKRLSAAQRDGDCVLAILAGSAINQDGRTNGITAPNGNAQEALLRRAVEDAGVEPTAISLIESHGTGTLLGDPIEFASLHGVYGGSTQKTADGPCRVGALKANIGHLEAAAGIAGLLKLVLAIQHQELPPLVGLQERNPHLTRQSSRLGLDMDLRRWRADIPSAGGGAPAVSQAIDCNPVGPRLAAVSSFGFGGTNAHVIVAEPSEVLRRQHDATPPPTRQSSERPVSLPVFTLSANDPQTLQELCEQTRLEIASTAQRDWHAWVTAANRMRSSGSYRIGIIADDVSEAEIALSNYLHGRPSDDVIVAPNNVATSASVAMLFTGQASQYAAMGSVWYANDPVFRSWVDRCEALLRSEFQVSAVSMMQPTRGEDRTPVPVDNQCALFVLEWALAQSFRSRGIQAAAVLGHSMGEYAAAAIADVMDWQDALRLTATRSRAVAQMSERGKMAMVVAPLETVRKRTADHRDRISIAAINSPQHIVLSGETSALEGLLNGFTAEGLTHRMLPVDAAFHSPLLDPVLPEIRRFLATVELRRPRVRYVSTLTGQPVDDELCDVEYWCRHTRETVRFSDGLEALQASGVDVFLEIGPHPTLCGLGKLNPVLERVCVPTLRKGHDDVRVMRTALAQLYVSGVDIDWLSFSNPQTKPVRLATRYPFVREPHWYPKPDVPSTPIGTSHEASEHDLNNVPATPSPSSIHEAVKEQIANGQKHAIATYHAGKTDFDALCINYFQNALRSIASDQAVAPEQQRFHAYLRDLESNGQWSHVRSIEDEGTFVDSLRARFPHADAELTLAQRCGKELASVLTGDRTPLEVLFPGGDFSVLERLYRDSVLASHCNALLSDAAAAWIDQAALGRPARLLEVGGGTGGTTRPLLSRLSEHSIEYTFTDVSPVFTAAAEGDFANGNHVTCQTLNIERSPRTQGFAEQSFDLVVAANVIHATRDIRTCLDNTIRLLRPGGTLLLLEGTTREPLMDLVFGITPGWWRFQDADLRPSHALLENAQWVRVLAEAGFLGTTVLNDPQGLDSSQNVIVAQRRGELSDSVSSVAATSSRPASTLAPSPPAEASPKDSDSEPDDGVAESLRAASAARRQEMLVEFLTSTLQGVLGANSQSINLDQPLNNLGVDSLMAIQLKNRVEAELQLAIPMVAFVQGFSGHQLIEQMLEQLEQESPASKDETPAASNDNPSAAGEDADHPALSIGQRSLWTIAQITPDSPAYNFAFAARTNRKLDLEHLRRVCNVLLQRHPILRTVYRANGVEEPIRVLTDANASINAKDCSGWSQQDLASWVRSEADRPFDLQAGPVVRFHILQEGDNDTLAIFIHHIAADLWSMDLLIRQVIDLYDEDPQHNNWGKTASLPTPYDSYVTWERELATSEEGQQLRAFWKNRLADAPAELTLPTTHDYPAVQTFQGECHGWSVASNVLDGLKDIALAQQTTLFTTVLSAYQAFLGRICNTDDVLVGTVSANRGRPDWESTVGYFLNQVVVRSRLDETMGFGDLVAQTRSEMLEVLQHQALPFTDVVKLVDPPRDPRRAPLVQTMFIWDKPNAVSIRSEKTTKDGLELHPFLMEQRGAPCELSLIVFEIDGELSMMFRYNTDLFSAEAIAELGTSFSHFLGQLADHPKRPLKQAGLLDEVQRHRQVASFNETRADLSDDQNVVACFLDQVEKAPEAIAISHGTREITYRELADQAAAIATTLGDAIQKGDRVGLAVRRGPNAIAGMLGIWHAGGVYVPLDCDYPTARLQWILEDCQPVIVLTDGDSDCEALTNWSGIQVLITDAINSGHTIGSPAALTHDDPAYVIYTSGSTGQPKGAVNLHGGLANLLTAAEQVYDINPSDRILLFASLNFDASVFEILMGICAGACLSIPDMDRRALVGRRLNATLRSERITVVTLPPPVLANTNPEGLTDLRIVVSAGEACTAQIVERWSRVAEVYNAYGPTEATVWSTVHRTHADGDDPNIGQPICNTACYVLDQQRRLLPVGVPGHLHVGGAGVSAGYLNQPALTARAFIPNPVDDAWDTVYCTGDRVRWTPGGEVEFLGRIDNQVKVDGHRMELGEIETCLRRVAGIRDAAVVLRTGGDSKSPTLIAFLVAASPELDVPRLRTELATQLPSAMIPRQFEFVDALPLNPNGKVDRKSLLQSAPSTETVREDDREIAPPETELEQRWLEIWREVLDTSEIGIDDNFFTLGGASLQAIGAVDKAAERGMHVPVERLFQHQTIRQLASVTAMADPVIAEPSHEELSKSSDGSTNAVPSSEIKAVPTSENTVRPSIRSPRMVVESLGVYLPSTVQSTAQVVNGCHQPLDFPLEEMSGIRSRRVAGNCEYSIDLARKAAQDCLARSRHLATEIDLLVACNISRYDGPNFQVSYEPTTAAVLADQLAMRSAVTLDICNACAGFFTALRLVQSMLHVESDQESSRPIRRAMVVSGEYISHLSDTAQKEIDGFMDPRLACLTLGDAGAAVIVEMSERGAGFESIDLYSAGRYHDLCVAKATDRSHGGAIMLTDPIRASAVTLEHAVPHACQVMDRHGWKPGQVDQLIIHQTSSKTIEGAMDELNRVFGETVSHSENTVNNLPERGNTASTSHWVAMMDQIQKGRVQAGDRTVFAISGSGQTIGTALYRMDDLPDRVQDNDPNSTQVLRAAPELGEPITRIIRPRSAVRLVTSALATQTTDVLTMASDAAQQVIAAAEIQRSQIALAIHAGVYRDEYLSEPAVAAILVGELDINAEGPTETGDRTLAFDASDGGRGTLMACLSACELLPSLVGGNPGLATRERFALITAAEVENNDPERGEVQRGISEEGSALLLGISDAKDRCQGFISFATRRYPEYADTIRTHTQDQNGRPVLIVHRNDASENAFLDASLRTALDLLEAESMTWSDIRYVIPPQISGSFLADFKQRLADDVIVIDATCEEGDRFTSGMTAAWRNMNQRHRPQPDEVVLVLSVAAGLEVAAALYRF
ncbi:MAG: amino acid adenylation domain-containing protein [Planctomycetota bacterium]